MESIISAAQNEIEQYSNPETNLCKFDDQSCDAMMLGLIFRAFRKIRIYPEASAVTTKSVEEVNLILRGVEFPEFLRTNKPTGCCNSPLLCEPPPPSFGGGGLFGSSMHSHSMPPQGLFGSRQPRFGSGGFGGPPVTESHTCGNCQNTYKALQGADVNHAEHCLPLSRLKKNLDEIVGKVSGLEYSQFIRKGSEGEQVEAGEQAAEGLWSPVEYYEIL